MIAYPDAADLEAWVAPRYWSAYREGSLRPDYLSNAPFPHAVLPDFLRPEVFERLNADCTALLDEAPKEEKSSRRFAFPVIPELVGMLYGPEARGLLGSLTGRRLARPTEPVPAATALVQLRRYERFGAGITAHTDANVGFDMALLLYLKSDWRPGLGGEATLFRRVGGLLLEDKVVPPLANTAMLMFFSNESHHCVREMAPNWSRSNLFIGWQTFPAEPAEEHSLVH